MSSAGRTVPVPITSTRLWRIGVDAAIAVAESLISLNGQAAASVRRSGLFGISTGYQDPATMPDSGQISHLDAIGARC